MRLRVEIRIESKLLTALMSLNVLFIKMAQRSNSRIPRASYLDLLLKLIVVVLV